MNSGEKISSKFVVARGDAPVVLDFVEEALDEIALTIEHEITIALHLAVGFGGITGMIARPSRVSINGSAS